MQQFTKRQVQAMNTKSKIFDTTIKLMNTKGYKNITIKSICNEADISVGTFYHHFNSKSDILIEIYVKADNYFYNNVKQNLSSIHALDKIIEYFTIYAKYNEDIGLDVVKALYNSNNIMFITNGRYMQTILVGIIKEGQEKNEITSDMSPEKITKDLFILMRGVIYDWCLHDGNYNLQEKMLDILTRIIQIFKGIT